MSSTILASRPRAARTPSPLRLLLGAFIALLLIPAASAQDRGTWTLVDNPDAPYGHCRTVSSAFGPRWVLVQNVGESTEGVLEIQVLRCQPFSGGGLSKVDCEASGAHGVPYAYCVRALNDGLGNDITIGVMRRDAVTDANGRYTGCPAGADLQPKLDVVRAAGVDARRLDGVVTLSCAAASRHVAKAVPTEVACPPEPQPYARCIATANDGHGNAVTLGLLHANGPGDTNGLYGECDTAPPITPGLLYKADAVLAAGKSLDNVRSIDLEYCAMGAPQAFHAVACEDVATFPPIMAARLDYCVVGTDVHNNSIVLGVSGK